MSIVLEEPTHTPLGGGSVAFTPSLPITWIDKGLAFIVLFLLTYNTPVTWFYETVFDNTVKTNDTTGDGQVLPFLAITLVYIFLSLRCDVIPLIRAALREPFLLALVTWAVLTYFWSGIPGRTLTQSLNIAVIAVIGYWMASRFTVAQFLGVVACVYGIGTVLHWVFVLGLGGYGRTEQGWDGIMGNRNTFGASCALAIVLFLTTARVYRRYRVLAYAAAGANFALVLGSTSKTSLVMSLGLPVAMLIYSVFRARKTLYAAVAVTMSIFAVIVVAVAIDQLPKLSGALDRETNLSGRTDIWAGAVELIKAKPWFGYGWDAVFFDWNSPARIIWLKFNTPIYHSHNGLLEVTLNGGLVAAFLALAVLIRLVIRGARLVRYYRNAIGMLPLTYASYVFISSITEPGIYYRGSVLLMYVVLVTVAGRGRRGALTAGEGAELISTAPRRGLRRG